jgi:hypothetical protein
VLIAVLALDALLATSVPGPDALGRWILATIFALFGGPIALAVVPSWLCRPYRFGVVDADRCIVRFRAKNPAYTELLMDKIDELEGILAEKPKAGAGPLFEGDLG